MPVEKIADEIRREYLIADLQRAIELMADRYAESTVEWATALRFGTDDRAAKFRRRRRRQRVALRRLTQALANLAGGTR